MTATAILPTVPAAIEPTLEAETTFVACSDPKNSDLNAANRVKGFLGMTGEIVPSMPADPVAYVKSLTDAELFSAGERALRDIADDIIILDEIRNRFRAAGRSICGYQSWKDFVEKNSIYSIRTIQRRLAEVHGRDLSKVNAQPGNMYTRSETPAVISAVTKPAIIQQAGQIKGVKIWTPNKEKRKNRSEPVEFEKLRKLALQMLTLGHAELRKKKKTKELNGSYLDSAKTWAKAVIEHA